VNRPWEDLLTSVRGLPGVGPKMAERIALHLLRRPGAADGLLKTLEEAARRLKRCARCGDLVDAGEDAPAAAPDGCPLCREGDRDEGMLCVVEEIGDRQALERSRSFGGRYHVLGGALSALDGVGPEDLKIDALLSRVDRDGVKEVILATNPTAEGETTAAYIGDLLKSRGVPVTRLATGLPSGSVIQYADEYTLARAMEGRRPAG
jgi:recombination protein RecR